MTHRTSLAAGLPGLALAAALLAGACSEAQDPFAVAVGTDTAAAPRDRFALGEAGGDRTRIETAEAAPAVLARRLSLPGRVAFAEDRRASVVARLEGVLTDVRAGLGDHVEAGELLAALQSRELARTRSAALEAQHRLEFARVAFQREQRLWDKRITSEEAFLRASHALEEAELARTTTQQELAALAGPGAGAAPAWRDDDTHDPTADLTRFELRAPMAGVIVRRSAVLGEAVADDTELFEIADLEHVWVDLRVGAGDLQQLAIGDAVRVHSRELALEVDAALAYLDPRVDPATQTGLARIELDNAEGRWRPGLFVDVGAEIGHHEAAVSVPLRALHSVSDTDTGGDDARVFVDLGDGRWEARAVRVGRRDESRAEILGGLAAGEAVAVSDGPLLKAWWLGQAGGAP